MGGNSTKATSGINGAGTQSQQDLGIQDSSRIFFEDTKKSVRVSHLHGLFIIAKPIHRLVTSPATILSPS